MKLERIEDIYRGAALRVRDFEEVERILSRDELVGQAQRCMNCGIPFCHGSGCPLGNVIPEFNAALAAGEMRTAYEILSETSYFPEFTSRVCPALCEGSCTCTIDGDAVMVRQIEKRIIENAFASGWVVPVIPETRNGRSVAVIGGGPAGLCAAESLNRKGFTVTVYEKHHNPGGLLRYGIPDFKLSKKVIERRLDLMKREGITFVNDTEIGRDVAAEYLLRNHDAIVLAVGTPAARDLNVPGRDFDGIHFALELLQHQNRLNAGELSDAPVSAANKNVVVIGGGDTGSDCVGTAIRQGAKSILQIEIMPCPPQLRSPSTPWPQWPYLLRTSSSHKEGGERRWNLATKRFLGGNGILSGVEVIEVEWTFSPDGKPLKFSEKPDSLRVIPADLVLLAMGFTGVPETGLVNDLALTLTPRGALQPDPARRIFACGDCANGASLVVRAMADGKKVAESVATAFSA